MGIKRKHRGSYSELKSILWLMENGFDCFRAVSVHGPVDIVAIRGDEILKIDTKTVIDRRRRPPPGDICYLLVGQDTCELIRPLPPPRRALPVRDRRPPRRDHRARARRLGYPQPAPA
jgi:hypothetical protein